MSEEDKQKRLDWFLGKPIRPLCYFLVCGLPFAAIGLLAYRLFPRDVSEIVWHVSFAWFAACFTMGTPYLMIAALCFYAMTQLPFPKSLSTEALLPHLLLLLAVAFLFWRTWVNWPASYRSNPPKSGQKTAPWWGYILGGAAAIGLFALMAYFFHFQD